jgi:predicted ATP-grasp superfamily ATP-dependent carboligase
MARITVTDGDERAALAIVRSLGKAGHHVTVVSNSGRSLAGGSRYAQAEEGVPSPLSGPDAFLEALGRHLSAHRIDLLIPVSEGAALPILDHREALSPVRIPFPTARAFRGVSDKSAVLNAAEQIGIAVPTLEELTSVEEALTRADAGGLPYPVVLKPTRSVVDGEDGRRKTQVCYAGSAEELRSRATSLGPAAFPVLLQRKVEGPGLGVFVLMHGGEVIASFGHRRIREKPPSGGVSVLRESVAVPDSLLQSSVELLRCFDWEGVAMIEYKLDRTSGKPYLMEINGRFWGSLQLAIDAGVDFPRLLVDAALGSVESAPPPYRIGVQSRWFWGDVDHLLKRMLHSREALGLDASEPGRLGALAQFLRAFLPPARGEVGRLGDPRPALRESRAWITSAFRSRRGGT